MSTSISLSIVVPVLNEAALIGDSLPHLRKIAPNAEIIVVDGGSLDATVSIARPLADVVLSTRAGRAVQMNAGAAIARGEVLWFVHADLALPADALRELERAMSDSRVAGGCFRLRFPRPSAIYRVSDSLGNIGVHVFGFALGDHAIFCRREYFRQIGGYREVPILEDAELYRALHRIGRMKQLALHVRSSPRAYERYGPYWTTGVYFLILVLYVLGTPIAPLHAIYRWLRRKKVSAHGPTFAPAAQP